MKKFSVEEVQKAIEQLEEADADDIIKAIKRKRK